MATRRNPPTRFDRDNRIRVRDNVKVKHIMIMSPYVISCREDAPKNVCDIIEMVVPITGNIYNIVISLKDASEKFVSTLYKNDEEIKEDFYGHLVEEGDVLRYTLKAEDGRVNVASRVLCSIAILPTYKKDFVLRTKVDKK